jgi:hypothetical protein
MLLEGIRKFLVRPFVGDGGPTDIEIHAGVPKIALPKSAPKGIDLQTTDLTSLDLDGYVFGGDGKAYAPGTPLESIPSIMPADGVTHGRWAADMNGIGESPLGALGNAQLTANTIGHELYLFYNATGGFAKDGLQTVGDKLNIGDNKAVDTAKDYMYQYTVDRAEPFNMVGHSQGALDFNRAAEDYLLPRLAAEQFTPDQIARVTDRLRGLAFASASTRDSNAVSWMHFVNRSDIVQILISGAAFSPLNPVVHFSEPDLVDFFITKNPIRAHDLGMTYLPQYEKDIAKLGGDHLF